MTTLGIIKKESVRCLTEAAKDVQEDLLPFFITASEMLNEQEDAIREACRTASVIIIERGIQFSSPDIESEIRTQASKIPVIFLGGGDLVCSESLISREQQEICSQYFINGGTDNLKSLFLYIRSLKGELLPVPPPLTLPRQGIYHPRYEGSFQTIEEYLQWYQPHETEVIGILIDRSFWVNDNLEVENTLIECLEHRGISVIPAFTDSFCDPGLGSIGLQDTIRRFFVKDEEPRVCGIIKLISPVTDPVTPVDEAKEPFIRSLDLIKSMNIPVFQPVVSYYQSLEEWKDLKGLTDDVPWAVSLPEYEGVIEPVMIGSNFERPGSDGTRVTIPERCGRVADRISRWIRLMRKEKADRRVVFMLNNSPCHGVEATVGSASHMNGLQSMVQILNRMKEEGYTITDIPEDGQALVNLILERRALCEFRWTTVEDIVAKGGALARITTEEYNAWYDTLDPTFKEKVNSVWGEPPGEGMVYEGTMLITGVRFGNILVCCQPKRGCYGPKCDGKVCKILHDPYCPPPHQYLATYHYLEEDFDADLLVHLGTHGSLELTPGNGVGMSRGCSPDVCIGNKPYLYIYNANNPPEGALAKRRTYATLIDYMLSVMDQSSLYEKLEELDEMLQEYETARADHARKHALEHQIRDLIFGINLDNDMHLEATDSFEILKGKAHEVLSKIRNTQIIRDIHVFGEIPEGEKQVEFINNIARFDIGELCIRRVIAGIFGHDFDDLYEHQNGFSESAGKSHGAIIEELDLHAKEFIRSTLEDPSRPLEDLFSKSLTKSQEDLLQLIQLRILDISERLVQSKEIEALLNGMEMGHTPPGPSGYLSRGQDDILPTGRNFYCTDPYRTPTRSAWMVGKGLADSLLRKYQKEEGKLPENVGFFWMAMDMMCCNGETLAQMMYLIGVQPVWNPSGQVRSFQIISLEELGRPRIDLTIEMTSTLRDCYPTTYELMDDAISAVAALDEPLEMNYIRKHALMSMPDNNQDWRESTLRIFSNPPGVYVTAVALAVHASAWETEKDLVDVFMTTGGYAYGKAYAGQLKPEQFARNLSTVNITFDKTGTDSCDILGCCCYFGYHGGMTTAARHYNPDEVKVYYGDTREPDHPYVHDMADELRRMVRGKILNPKWIEAMKKAGYNGAASISTRTEHIMGWQASIGEVDDWVFDEITKTFVLDPEMKQFFEEKNKYAFEELTRRLLEANQRELWDADPEVLEGLKNTYLEVESWLEDEVGEGDHQGGSVDIITARDVDGWGKSISEMAERVDKKILGRYLNVESGKRI
ncbi:MAG: cobaltochelatase subunit CobN [Methanospirillum sp.]|uniref:cobaltochelatase subunit CobN n=1 Tax=Methanospirillum sp. TaxID=45200 RepID=UPI002375AE14|nr:cobaltochelatase subunit CobN [Methanospirillum sp.]MDD1729678.1 cobaltochelatase subunit CobN [Methanospirillum sp.]